MSVTDPEASRQLGRLTKARLVAKTADGSFGLTPLGRVVRTVLPAFYVLAERHEYLLTHDLTAAPGEFLRRIGELAEHRYLAHLDDILGVVEEITAGANEYVWLMGDHTVRLEHHHPAPQSLAVRCLIPREFDAEVRALLGKNWPGAKTELAYIEPTGMTLVLNEREACALFPGLDRRVDLNTGLAGTSPLFLGWCRDLFEYHARRARKALL